MATNIIEEYLVGLGFDLNDEKYQEFKKHLDEAQKKTSDFDKASEDSDKKRQANVSKRAEAGKKENDWLLDTQKTMRQIVGLSEQLSKGSILGSFFAGASSLKSIQAFLDKARESRAPRPEEAAATPPIQQKKAPSMKNYAEYYTSGADEFTNPFASSADEWESAAETAEKAKAAQAGTVAEKSLQAGITGQAAGEAAGAAGEAGAAGGSLAGAASAILPVAIAAAAVAAIVKIGSEISKLTNSLSNANIEIESMSKKMWITDSAAWNLNNALTAMGKSTADLNDIALNPTLKKQFEDLQDFQKTLKLPADFQDEAKKWALGVGEGSQKLKMANSYMKQVASYDLERAFSPFVKGWYSFWTKVALGIDKLLGIDVSDIAGETNSSARASQSLTNGAYYAPQASSYTAANADNLTVHNSPSATVNVYTNSDDPKSIGSAVSSSIESSFDDAALIKSLQSMSR